MPTHDSNCGFAVAVFFVNENHRPCRWFQKALAMQRKKYPPLVLWVWFANRTHNTKEESSLDET